MNLLEFEIVLLEREAIEVQRKYPKAKTLPDYLKTITTYLERLREKQRETTAFIESIQDERVKEIARLRLVDGLTYEEIADTMHYNSSHVQRLWRPYREQWEEVHNKSGDGTGGPGWSRCGCQTL